MCGFSLKKSDIVNFETKKKSIERLFFVERLQQVERIIREMEPNKDDVIISLSPSAGYALEKYDVQFNIPENYYEMEELKSLSFWNYNKVTNFCEIMNKSLVNYNQYFENVNMQFFYIPLKRLIDTFSYRIFEITRIIDHHRPKEIIYWGTESKEFDGTLKFDDPLIYHLEESIYSHTIDCVVHSKKIKSMKIEPENNKVDADSLRVDFKNKFIKLTKEILGQSGVIKLKYLWNGNIKFASLQSKKDIICIFMPGWGLDYLLPDLQKEYQLLLWYPMSEKDKPIFLSPFLKRIRLNFNSNHLLEKLMDEAYNFWNKVKVDLPKLDCFSYDDINFFNKIESRIEYIIRRCIPIACTIYEKSKRLFSEHKPAILFGCQFLNYLVNSVVYAGKKLGIPIVTYQHGGGVYGDYPLRYWTDEWLADYKLVWGEGFLRHPKYRYNTKLIPVGSAQLEQLRRNNRDNIKNKFRLCKKYDLNPSKPIIFYVLTDISGNRRLLPNPSDNIQFYTQRKIIETFRDFENYQFIIKMSPSPLPPEYPLQTWLKEEGFDNCKIIRYTPFTSLLPLGDMFILDYLFTSTVVIQCLTTSKKVMIYDGIGINNEVLTILRKRAFVESELSKFCKEVYETLKSGKFEEEQNAEFLDKFGKSDGETVSRALEFFKKLCNKNEYK